MNLTPEQKQRGKQNFYDAVGSTRRDFLKAAVAAPVLGAFYFGYTQLGGNPVRAGLIGTGDEGGILLTESNPDYLRFVAYSDIRPSQRKRAMEGDPGSSARVGFRRKYGLSAEQAEKEIKFYEDYHQLLQDPNVEAVVIALPLHFHHGATIAALEAGKHVLCEKLMGHNVRQCKEMARKAEEKGLILAIGHQRHYSVLYDNARSLVDHGLLGDIQHIRALWHRNQTWPAVDRQGQPLRDAAGKPLYRDSWRKDVPEGDRQVDYAKHGYKSLEELVRWRLYNRTGAGLMAELGSHQLDACSIFLGKVHPLAVSGIGGKYFFDDDREVEDHVYVTFEFPGYDHPRGKNQGSNSNDVVVVTYSSISTNAMENYGEHVMGTRGSIIVESEQSVMLFKEPAPGSKATARETEVSVTSVLGGKPVLESAESPGSGPAAAGLAQATLADKPSKGYREEMEHFAWCIRNRDPANQPRCHPRVALADAVYALTSNLAIRRKQRIEFKADWFDPNSDAGPESEAELLAGKR
ncbi:MAG: Gfo/Idh/MocA family oxidoreductase [Planctomycetes bacterium]|nr:Gfo/Idh/MocA family oxidoreductase [Planctomycetota bacterium]